MKTNKTVKFFGFLFIGLLMLGMTIASALAESGTKLVDSNGKDFKMSGEFDRDAEESFSYSPLSFISQDTTQTDRLCTSTGRSSNIFSADPGETAGKLCNTGDFIRYYQCDASSPLYAGPSACSGKRDLFAHLWYKSSSSDVISYDAYWTRSLVPFKSYYECYSCKLTSDVVTTYSCWNDVWRGEPGTIYDRSDLTGGCPNGCKKAATTITSTDKSVITKELCSDSTVTVSSGNTGTSSGSSSTTSTTGDSSSGDTSTGGLYGNWDRITLPAGKTVTVGEDYIIEAVFTATSEGKYYLEAGAEEKPALGITTATGSKCNTDLHWAGDYVDLAAGESVTMVFNLKGRETPGKYGVVVGAYTGCLDNGGSKVKIEGDYITFVQEPGLTGGSSGTIFGEFAAGSSTDGGSGAFSLWMSIILTIIGIVLLFMGQLWFGVGATATGIIWLLLLL